MRLLLPLIVVVAVVLVFPPAEAAADKSAQQGPVAQALPAGSVVAVPPQPKMVRTYPLKAGMSYRVRLDIDGRSYEARWLSIKDPRGTSEGRVDEQGNLQIHSLPIKR